MKDMQCRFVYRAEDKVVNLAVSQGHLLSPDEIQPLTDRLWGLLMSDLGLGAVAPTAAVNPRKKSWSHYYGRNHSIEIAPTKRHSNVVVLVHEIAHAAVKAIRDDKGYYPEGAHGPLFCEMYLKLLAVWEQQIQGRDHAVLTKMLERRFRLYGVDYGQGTDRPLTMNLDGFRCGDLCKFIRRDGEVVRCEVLRVNPQRASVRCLETRHRYRVPYSLLKLDVEGL